MTTTTAPRAAGSSLLLLLAALALTFAACPPPEGSLDDDDTTDDDDDDDDDVSDDDDTGGDDDDFTIPPGIGLGGVLEYTPADGVLPPGAVRVGLVRLNPDGFVPDIERWSNEVSPDGLIGGDNIFTVYVEGDPDEADFFAAGDGWEVALYYIVAYVDAGASSTYTDDDAILGFSTDLFAFARGAAEDPPKELVALGGGYGWNVVDYESLTEGEPDIEHFPEGTNSATGPEISVDLLPVTGGVIPVSTTHLIPEGSVLGAFHTSIFGEGTPVDDYLLFPQAMGNFELRGDLLLEWAIDGPPPAGHLGLLEGFGVTGAIYLALGWYDDGDLDYSGGGCDIPLVAGYPEILMYVDPSSLTLTTAFQAQIFGFPMGWTLFDQELTAPRLFASGIQLEDLSVLDGGGGDDDDSAGDDDDDRAGDDDDSAGDDDDGDDDDDDDDSASSVEPE